MATFGVVLASAGPSHAATVLGEINPPGTPLGCSTGQVIVQTGTSTANDYSVPAGGGVITRWSALSWSKGSTPARVQLIVAGNDVTDDEITYVGLSSFGLLLTESSFFAQSFATRIPVSGGERLGLYGSAEPPGFTYTCAHGFEGGKANRILFGSVSPPVIGAPPTKVPSEVAEERIPLEAVLEADADHDGFGDESQDLCPAVAATQGPCPSPPAPALTPAIPDSSITKHPKLKTTKRKAAFEFISNIPGTTFECKLDAKPYRACRSPYPLQVSRGKHTLAVRAVAQGQVDPFPATFSWRVTKKPPQVSSNR